MAGKLQPGEHVRIRLSREEVEGTVLESHDSSLVLLKLKSGYNIGIPKENIHGHEVLSKHETAERVKKEFTQKPGLPTIGLVVTGGTIASKLDPKTGGVTALTDVNEFRTYYPGLFEMVNVKHIEVPFMKLSENMEPRDWILLAEKVHSLLEDKAIEGVIVTHGTDTLHYTAAALRFFLPRLSKPVVLTYAQRSIDRASSDADLNLRCAARMAISEAAEVLLVGHATLDDDFCYALLGTNVRKLHSSRRDAFKTVNTSAVAKVWPTKVEFLSTYTGRTNEVNEIDAVFNDKIALVKFHPGQSPEVLDYYFREGYKGVVVEALGLGHVASGDARVSWIPTIKRLVKEGFIICAAAQTVYGRLNPKVYSSGRELEKAGVIFLEDMLAETAYVKLGWVLGHRTWKTQVREKMLEPIGNETHTILTE